MARDIVPQIKALLGQHGKARLVLVDGATAEGTLHLYDAEAAALVLCSSAADGVLSDFRLIPVSAVRRVGSPSPPPSKTPSIHVNLPSTDPPIAINLPPSSPLVPQQATPSRKQSASNSGRATPKKSGASTPVRQETRREAAPDMKALPEDGKILLLALQKHLKVHALQESIIIATKSHNIELKPPYVATSIEGDSEEVSRVRQIVKSERSVVLSPGPGTGAGKRGHRREKTTGSAQALPVKGG